MFDSKDNAIEFLSFLNSQHDSNKFTIEFEDDSNPYFSLSDNAHTLYCSRDTEFKYVG